MRYRVSFFLALAACAASAAERTPEQIITAFFGPSGISDKASCYTGEMLSHFKDQPTLGQSLSPALQVNARPLSTSLARLVFAVTLAKNGSSQDWYAYLARESGQWKLEAVRTLALTGIQAMLLQQLQAKAQRTTEEERTLNNLMLMSKSDSELKTFVVSNLRQLEKVTALMAAGKAEAALTEAKRHFIHSVSKKDDGRIELIIGGLVDNSVGIAFVPKGTSPPPIQPDGYIYVELVRDGWYVFKTT